MIARLLLATLLVTSLALVPRSGSAADPVEIDAIVDITGPASFTGHDSVTALTAIEGIVNQQGGINGRPVKMVIHDSQTDPKVAVQLFNDLIARHRPVVLGPSIAATCAAVQPLVKDAIVAYCLSPAIHPAPGDYLFSTSTESTVQFTAIATYFAKRGYAKVATITATDTTGQDGDRSMDAAVAKVKGIDLVDREHFAPGDISVAAQMSRIKASGAQAMVAWSTGSPLGTILHAMADTGLAIPILTTGGNMSYAQLKAYAGITPRDLLFTSLVALTPELVKDTPTKNAIGVFDKALAAAGVSVPGFTNQTAWDPAFIVVSALRKLGPNATPLQIRDYIAGLRGWIGVNGPYDFTTHPQRGLGGEAVVIARWDSSHERFEAVSKGGGDPLPVR
jgi:branched-chain amino acid transport system substrate-binding protein